MRRSSKLCWVGFVLSTLLLALVVALVLYFTLFHGRAADAADEELLISPSSGVASGDGRPPRDSAEKAGLYDHRSHAVPGGDYEAVDYAGAGRVTLTLDGSRSHTHYFDDGPPVVIGRIVSMVWFDNATHSVLGTGVAPTIPFPVGFTVVGLTVTDNTHDTHTDFTRVTIKPPIVPGVYCYYYFSTANIHDNVAVGERPDFAARADAVSFESTSDFPPRVRARPFVARCVFRADVKTNMQFSFQHAGDIKFIVGDTTIHSSSDPVSSATYTGLPGKVDAELIYSRSSSSEARLELNAGVSKFEYDVSKVVPVILSIDPPSSTLDGGGKAKIQGISLGNSVKIKFGSREAKYNDKDPKEDGSSIIVTVPPARGEGRVEVVAENKNGASNAIEFGFSADGKMPIKFEESYVKWKGKIFDLQLLSGIKYGPDHKFYATSLDGFVYNFAINEKMHVVGEPCRSNSLGPHRAVLGIAFNPAESKTRAYVSSSILEWKSHGRLTSELAWANGQIHVLAPGADGNCLGEVGDPIITGLPVSNHDHGVNTMVFDNDGNLHIQVGGCTNAGHNQADSRLGGIEESPLSGASLIAYVSKPDFDGKVKYSSSDPGAATQTGGLDVKVFSSGWRNSFGINIHSNGFLYATDNGASTGFGEMSVSCTKHGPLPGNSNLADKLGKVIEGMYCGHPNRNRGRKDKKQCSFVGVKARSLNGYLGPIATFESSTNGVLEYTADTFGGQLKGNLMLSKYSTDQSPGKIFRVKLNGKGDVDGVPSTLWEASGLSIEMAPHGELLMPRVYKKQILVLRPISSGSRAQTFRAVMPPRGSFKGGNVVIVTGFNIGANPVALFDGSKCTAVADVTLTSFKCKVPPGKPGSTAEVIIESESGTTSPSKDGNSVDYKYMNI